MIGSAGLTTRQFRRSFLRNSTRRFLWHSASRLLRPLAFEPTSKRRKGFPSETQVKRGFPRRSRDQRTPRKTRRERPVSVRRSAQVQELLHALRLLSTEPNAMITRVDHPPLRHGAILASATSSLRCENLPFRSIHLDLSTPEPRRRRASFLHCSKEGTYLHR